MILLWPRGVKLHLELTAELGSDLSHALGITEYLTMEKSNTYPELDSLFITVVDLDKVTLWGSGPQLQESIGF